MQTERLQTDRQNLKSRAGIIVPIAREILTGTALMEKGRQFSEVDEEAVKNLMIAAAPYSHPKTLPDFVRHSLTVGLYLKEASKELNLPNLNPSEAFCIGLLHDWPPVAPHQYLRKNIASDLILGENNIGIREDLHAKFPEILSILQMRGRMGKGWGDFLKRDEVQILGDAMDNIGRVTPEGKIRDPYEFLTELETKYNKNRKAFEENNWDISGYLKTAVWPSSRKGISAMFSKETDRSRFAANLTKQELSYLKWVKGLHLDELRHKVEQKCNEPKSQSFILDFLNAQETLDPEIDKKLGRPGAEMAVFDIGGVFLTGSDDELIRHISKTTGAEYKNIEKAFKDLVVEGMEDEKPDFYERFSRIAGTKITRENFEAEGFFKPVGGMKAILDQLSKSGFSYIFWSNAFLSRAPFVKKAMTDFYGVDPKKIIISSEHQLSKYDVRAFEKIARLLGKETSKLILIDDSETYTANAKASGMRGITFRGSPHKNISAQERLLDELKLAKII